MANLLLNVVFPDEEGPETNITFIQMPDIGHFKDFSPAFVFTEYLIQLILWNDRQYPGRIGPVGKLQ